MYTFFCIVGFLVCLILVLKVLYYGASWALVLFWDQYMPRFYGVQENVPAISLKLGNVIHFENRYYRIIDVSYMDNWGLKREYPFITLKYFGGLKFLDGEKVTQVPIVRFANSTVVRNEQGYFEALWKLRNRRN